MKPALALLALALPLAAADPSPPAANLALVAAASTSYVSGHEQLSAINDGASPRDSGDKSHGVHGNWPRHGTQWVQYEWPVAVSIRSCDVYWFDDHNGVRLPQACRLKYWNGSDFAPVPGAEGLGVAGNTFNHTTFPVLSTTKLRLEMDGAGQSSTGVSEWRVEDSGQSPNFAPSVTAGSDRTVVLPGRTYLSGHARDDGKPQPKLALRWSKQAGPGEVTFSQPAAATTDARFSATGDYVLQLTADDGDKQAVTTVRVKALAAPPAGHLDPVWTTPYQVSSPLWRARLKSQIVTWIPHCVAMMNDPKTREGSIENFVQAGRRNAGATDAKHAGPVFSDGWFYNIAESMCLAQMIDPQGDQEIIDAQAALRRELEKWIPIILSAQAPDGYLHTQYIIQNRPRWRVVHDHEGYQAGYFIELGMAHHRMTGGKDRRLLDAAIRLADCWVANIGPAPKKSWFDGHQALEMSLVRLADYVASLGGPNHGAEYLALAKFLLDARRNGSEYDQSHVPVVQQYEAVGHAVRAVYSYTGMAEVALATGDPDYLSAVSALNDNLVNRKYYVTGGVGSGETSEGFGKDYSLPNNAYCESCSGCGEMYFQHAQQRIWQDAAHADLLEETLYNAVLGSVDLAGQNFTYTNALDSSEKRYRWHDCPCCVGNIPRTLLSLPTWMYTRGPASLQVNQYLGSRVTIAPVAGTAVTVTQTTDYPWDGKVQLAVQPAQPTKFALHLRVPNRQTSSLYTHVPAVAGLVSLSLNGQALTSTLQHGYAVIEREWKAGDTVSLELPLPVQTITPSPGIAATVGRIALRRGPLVYNLESADQKVDAAFDPASALSTEWRSDLLGGVMVLKGEFRDGKPLLAIPNYARLNRPGRSIVWIKR